MPLHNNYRRRNMSNSLTKARKGVTPIIAIIILLLITIALAGAAWSYISVYWSSITGKNIIVVEGFCTEGDIANVLVRNAGTLKITLSEISVIDISTSLPVPLQFDRWHNIEGTTILAELVPGITARYNVSCTGYCSYKFIYGGAIGLSSQPVSVAC